VRLGAFAAAGFAAVGMWLALGPSWHVTRVRHLTIGRERPDRTTQLTPSPSSPADSVWLRRLVAGLAGFAVALIVGDGLGVVVGALAAVGGYHWLSGMETTAARRARLMVARDLPLAAELLGAALRAGVPPGRAVDAVAEALGGPLGQRLMTCRWTEVQGAEPHRAWKPLTADPTTAGLGRLIVESGVRGIAPAGSLAALATDLRTSTRLAADGAARSVGARVAAPLGLCFLPAFLLLGVVPLVAAAASTLIP
jgi:Flp pilus assembly protein TadB